LGLWGIERDVGWLSGAVERVRGVHEVPWLAMNRGEGLLHNILVLNKNLAWISFSTFSQTLKYKGEELLLPYTSTRES
jgi:hypothetical protein